MDSLRDTLAAALSEHGVFAAAGEARCLCGVPFPGDWREGEVVAAVWPHIADALLARQPLAPLLAVAEAARALDRVATWSALGRPDEVSSLRTALAALEEPLP